MEKSPTPAELRLQEARRRNAVGAMRRHGTKAAACRAADVSRHVLERWLAEDPDFALEMHHAHEDCVDDAVQELRQRAVEGDSQLVYYRGEPVPKRDPTTGDPILDDNFDVVYYTRDVKSDDLLKFFLAAKRNEFRTKSELALSGPDGGPIRTDNRIELVLVDPAAEAPRDVAGDRQAGD